MSDDTPPHGLRLVRHVPPEWLSELQATVVIYRGTVAFGQVCLVRESTATWGGPTMR